MLDCYQTVDVYLRYIWCQVGPPAPLSLRPSQLPNWQRSTRLDPERHFWTFPGLNWMTPVSSSSSNINLCPQNSLSLTFTYRKVDCDSGDIIETRNTRQQSCSVIKSAGVTRTFSSLSLSGFLVLLSGSSGRTCRLWIYGSIIIRRLSKYELQTELITFIY